MMTVTCKHCQTRFKLNSALLSGGQCKVRCSICRHVFVISGKETTAGGAQPMPSASDTGRHRGVPRDVQSNSRPSGQPGKRPRLSPDRKPFPPPKVIAVSNQKGGVAKTTTCLNLGMALSQLNQRVLLVDFDVQANLTVSLGYPSKGSFYEALTSDQDAAVPSVIQTAFPNLWLLPADNKMVLLDKEYLRLDRFEHRLKSRLEAIPHPYDYILIDTPPSVGFFTLNALTAAQMAIIPCQCDFFSTQGVEQIIKVIRLVKGKTNPEIDFRVLTTMYDARSAASKTISTKLKEIYGARVFASIIALDSKIRESQIMRLPILAYSKDCPAAVGYLGLAREVSRSMNRNGQPTQLSA